MDVNNGSNTDTLLRHGPSPLLKRNSSIQRSCELSVKDTICAVRNNSNEIQSSEIKIGREIGSGAFGSIFKGTWNGKKCALKMLGKGTPTDSQHYLRHIVEIAIMNDLNYHPNIIQFYGACLDDVSAPIIVEELVDGPNLEEYLRPKRLGFNLGQAKIYAWALHLLGALEHLHNGRPSIIHRDIKPENLLVAEGGRTLKLIDFGLSKRIPRGGGAVCHRGSWELERRASMSSDEEGDGGGLASHTGRIGTPRYGAPEVFHIPGAGGDAETDVTGAYTEKADVYSAAVILWYLIAGRRPKLDIRRDAAARPDIEAARRRWPEAAALLERMWAGEPGRRPSAEECVAWIRRLPLRAGACGLW